MADEKTATIELERTYNIPLRKEFQKAPSYKRAKKAVSAVRKFLMKHMKTEQVKVGKYLNLEIWKDGIKNPPHHVKVVAKKDSEGIVFAELEGAPEEKVEKKEEEKKTGEKPEADKDKARKSEVKEEKPKVEGKKTEVKEEKPKVEKEEVKETKKEEKVEEKPKEVKEEKKVEKKAEPKKESIKK